MYQIGIIEDDENILTTLQLALNAAGYKTWAHTSAEGFLASREHCDLLIVDVNLPKMNGIALCKLVRQQSQLPIIVLTAKIDEDTAVSSLSSGANDFIRKPFGMSELRLRIEKILQAKENIKPKLHFRGLEIDPENRTCRFQGAAVNLTVTEFDILYLLASMPDRVFSRENILLHLNETSETADRTLDSHVSRIRQKLKSVDSHEIKVISVYGVGYKLGNDGT